MHTPLAEKLRPQTLDDFVGQGHLKSRLRAIIQGKRLQSTLFFGPPGCGKSTLALLIARASGRSFVRFSAPEIGLAKLRQKISGVDILILDELHRFSKAQQDFFLPLLESGEIVLLATTTENPSFSVTRQLLSRLNVLKLHSLNHNELLQIARKGKEILDIEIPEQSLELLAFQARGDARTLLNLLEYTASLNLEERTPEKLKTILPEIIIRGNRDGDAHYELASALIKSIRGSDPDAALYYLACLLEGGEDPRFICRRLILSASEDIGLADPTALPLAVSCQQAIEFVGMPEGFIPLAETVVYLALAPKSNSTYAAYLAAQKEVRLNGPRPVPLHLRNASTGLQKEWGYGKNYKYPHSYPGAWVEQDYLPQELLGRRFYHPKDQGQEPRLLTWIRNKKRKK
ncbi:replication-associated recombination protein A [Desulfovulcanus sp.]